MKKTIRDYDLKDKKVIIRVDFNVPIKDGIITDDNRIKESLKTIEYAIENGAKVILLSHLGRIKTEEDKLKQGKICVGALDFALFLCVLYIFKKLMKKCLPNNSFGATIINGLFSKGEK